MDAITTKRFSIDEYHRLIELGFIQEGDRIELVQGELIKMVAKGFAHSACNDALSTELIRLVGDRAIIRSQNPVALFPDSEPEPDVVIARGSRKEFFARHPQSQDVVLIIEVSDSTLKYDQTIKLQLYARAGIAHYWIVNLIDGQLESYSQPYQQRGSYSLHQIYLPSQSVTIPDFGVALDLSNIFPDNPSYLT